MDRIKESLRLLMVEKDYLSGDAISGRLHVSRTAVWKYINRLERLGYRFSKLKGKGYKLTATPDKLYSWEIERYLHTKSMGSRIIYKEHVDSTNILAFKLALQGEQEGTCIIAETQGSGKGRLGRKWFSPPGKNLYMSVILKPFIHPSRVYPITFISSLAAYDVIEALTGKLPTVKWPNDVLIDGKKVCGTLLEISTEADIVRFVIVGIGFNVNMEATAIDEDIKGKATSLLIETKKCYERALVCAMILDALERYYGIFKEQGEGAVCALWENRANIRGKYMEITQMDEAYKGVAEGIDKDGALILNVEGTLKKIIAGDVSF